MAKGVLKRYVLPLIPLLILVCFVGLSIVKAGIPDQANVIVLAAIGVASVLFFLSLRYYLLFLFILLTLAAFNVLIFNWHHNEWFSIGIGSLIITFQKAGFLSLVLFLILCGKSLVVSVRNLFREK